MGKFSKIKKYNLKSLSIDEKIKFLDKELERTGLNEQPANSTAGVYVGSKTNTNQQYIEFTAKSFNGYAFGFSGDSNLGHKNVGGATIRADGAALSPPHPVTGVRRTTQTKAGIDPLFKIAIPGERPTPDSRKTGPILWYYDPNASSGQGSWRSLEYNSAAEHGNQPFPFTPANAGFGYWGSNFLGFPMLRSDGEAFASLFAALNDSEGNQFNPDNLSNPETVVLTQDRVDDPNFLPIDIAKRFIAELLGLAGEGLEYLGAAAAAAADPIGFLTRMGTLGLLQLGSFIQSVVGVEEVNRGMVNAMQQLLGHHNNNNPLHPDFRKHDPTSPNYEGPKPLDLDKKTAEEITKRLDTAISNLNGGNGPTNPNGNLTPDEITQVSDEMNRPYQNGSRDPASVTFYNSLHSLPPNATTFTVKDGKFDYFDTNYVFTDPRDANPLGGKLPAKLGNFVSNVVHGVTTQAVGNYGAGGGEPFYQYSVDDPKYGRGPNNKVIGTQYNTQTSFTRPPTLNESYITEGVKLGHFDPEALTVDIEDIRKGIMPEFPDKPPAEMIDGYSVKSKLAPKVIKGEPTIKVTKKDLAALHILKDSEIKELLQQIDLINAHLQNNPADLIYAQQRYPKTDIRLAKLNWKMDQMMNASKEYLDTQFPENQRLVDRIKKATKKTMELTNPEAYKNLNKPDMELMSLDDHMKQKRIVSRHFKKKRQSKSMFRVDMNKVKENNRKVAEQKVAEWQEKRRIELLNSNEFEDQKYDWRKEIGEDFVNTTQGMKVGQTFTHVPSGQSVTTSGILGGIETLQTSVEFFGDAIPGPDASQYGLQGFAKPIDMMRRGKKKSEDLNKELDSSEQYTKEIKADEFMKARVDNKNDDSYYYDRQKSGYYTEKLGPIHGAMTDLDELKMNERLVKEGERQHEIYKKNIPIIQAYNKKLENIVKPLLAKLNSGSEKKMKLKEFIRTQAGATDDGTYGVLIRHEGKNTVIYTYNGQNISPVGVGEIGQPGMYGQGTMNSDRKLDYPKRIKYEMPEDLQKWQAQAIDPRGAITRSAGSVLAKVGNVESAFNLVNYYIDNHVMGMYNQNFDPTKRHNVTSIFDNKTKDILRKGMDELKPQIDAKIKLGKLVNQSKPDLQKEIRDLVDNYFAHGGAGKSSRDIFNSLGNALGFNLETYMKTGNYQFDSTYIFTSTFDMGIRGKLGFLSGAARKYVSGQLYGETMMAVQNPMQFQVDIESGRQYTEIIDKRGRVTKPADPEPTQKPTPTPIQTKTASKTVQTVKKMASSNSVGFDRDDLSFKRKKKKS